MPPAPLSSVRIGIGSWSDQDYVGVLYPRGLPPAQRLGHCARWFEHLEINSSFYSVPKRAVVAGWIKQTPPGFLFEFKLHRHILSSLAKPPAPKRPNLLAYTLEQIEPMIAAKKLGAFLLVLPPSFGPEKKKLADLEMLVEKIKPHALAIELRDAAWIRGKQRSATLGWFRDRGVTLVSVDMPRITGSELMPPLDEVTNPNLAYLRLHGRNPGYLKAKDAAGRHEYAYPPAELRQLALRIRKLAGKAREVRVVANNHARDFAPRTALALKKILGQPAPGAP